MEEALHALKTFTAVTNGWGSREPYPALANSLWNAYHSSFPTVKKFTNLASKRARERGYIINAFGRKITIPPERTYIAANARPSGIMCRYDEGGYVSGVEQALIAWCETKGWEMWDEVEINLSIHDDLISHRTGGL